MVNDGGGELWDREDLMEWRARYKYAEETHHSAASMKGL